MKYKTIGAFKNVQNVPNCKAASDMYVGMGVTLDRADKIATLVDEDTALTCHYIVTNICDKPEIRNSEDAGLVKQGEYVRADDLLTVAEMEIEFAEAEITTAYADLAVGDILVFEEGGKLAQAEAATGYKVYFEILEKTAYMGKGVLALIHVGAPVAAGTGSGT